MLNRFITWLRRDDQLLEPLRRDVQQQEKLMDWEKIQMLITYMLIALGVVGFGVMVAMWISL